MPATAALSPKDFLSPRAATAGQAASWAPAVTFADDRVSAIAREEGRGAGPPTLPGRGSASGRVELEHLGEADVVARRVPERGVDAVGLGGRRVVEGHAPARELVVA